MLLHRYASCLCKMDNYRYDRRGRRVPEFVRVRVYLQDVAKLTQCFSDFFPVILNFLRQMPFIGNVLNLPYIRPVSVE